MENRAKSASYLLAHLRGDERLLDVGTGPGTIAADLAGHVSDLTVTEVDLAELDLARATLAKRGVEGVHFEVQDIHALTYADDSFDVAHAHQVLQHVTDPVGALREMRRVTRPGGLVAARVGCAGPTEENGWFSILHGEILATV